MNLEEIRVWRDDMSALARGTRDAPARYPGTGMRDVVDYLLAFCDAAVALYAEDECKSTVDTELLIESRMEAVSKDAP